MKSILLAASLLATSFAVSAALADEDGQQFFFRYPVAGIYSTDGNAWEEIENPGVEEPEPEEPVLGDEYRVSAATWGLEERDDNLTLAPSNVAVGEHGFKVGCSGGGCVRAATLTNVASGRMGFQMTTSPAPFWDAGKRLRFDFGGDWNLQGFDAFPAPSHLPNGTLELAVDLYRGGNLVTTVSYETFDYWGMNIIIDAMEVYYTGEGAAYYNVGMVDAWPFWLQEVLEG